jgi:hypothetical protein
MAIGLQQLGEKDYGPLIDEAIKTGLPHVRVEAAQFLGDTDDLFNVPRLVALLGDGTEWNGQSVAAIALQSLRQLTFQELPAESNAWRTWMADQGKVERGVLLERWLAVKRQAIATVPIWEANAWIAQLKTSTDARVLPLIADYVRRKDLDPHKIGPNEYRGQGGGGPKGMYGPAVVTVLLRLAQYGVAGAVNGSNSVCRPRIPTSEPSPRWRWPCINGQRPSRNWRGNWSSLATPRPSIRRPVFCSIWGIGADCPRVWRRSTVTRSSISTTTLPGPPAALRAATCGFIRSNRCPAMATPR